MFCKMRNRFFLHINHFFLLFIIPVYFFYYFVCILYNRFFTLALHYMHNHPKHFMSVNYLAVFLLNFSFIKNA